MSRINRIRIINLNYNHNRMCIDDETFDLASENTLFSLRNGGGKSVLVQMLTAPFVGKSKRNTSARPFASYFSSDKPTFILIEWVLDHEGGYVLTGMMVRKNQMIQDEENDHELEMINFIHEYQYENEFDIKHLPLVVQEHGFKKISTFKRCKDLFERAKQNPDLKFDFFDMNQYPKSRAYFEKLRDFQIYAKEWEDVIKKINLKESGLSELFKEAKNEKGLVEQWFFPAIESKLNQDHHRINESNNLLYKYILQYKRNKSSYERKEGILNFNRLIGPVEAIEKELAANIQQINEFERSLARVLLTVNYLIERNQKFLEDTTQEISDLNIKMRDMEYEKDSLEIYDLEDNLEQKESLEQYEDEKLKELKVKREKLMHEQNCLIAAQFYLTYTETSEHVQQLEVQWKLAKENCENQQPKIESLGYTIRVKLEQSIADKLEELKEGSIKHLDMKAEKIENKTILENLRSEEKNLVRKESQLASKIENFESQEANFNKRFNSHYKRNLEKEYAPGFLNQESAILETKIEKGKQEYSQNISLQQYFKEQIHALTRTNEDCAIKKGQLESELKNAKADLQDLEEQAEKRRQLLPYVDWKEKDLYNKEGLLNAFYIKINELKEKLHQQRSFLEKELEIYEKLKSGTILDLPKNFEEFLKEEGIEPVFGAEWLKKNKQNRKLLKNNPFLPYSIILSRQELEKIQRQKQELFIQSPIPIMIREELELGNMKPGFVDLSNIHFYVYFNNALLDEKQLAIILEANQKHLSKLETLKIQTAADLGKYEEKCDLIKHQSLSHSFYTAKKEQVENLSENLTELRKQIQENYIAWENSIKKENEIVKGLSDLNSRSLFLESQYEAFKDLKDQYEFFQKNLEEIKEVKFQLDELKFILKEKEENSEQIDEKINLQNVYLSELSGKIDQEKFGLRRYENYQEAPQIEKDLEDLKAEYHALTDKLGADLKLIQDGLDRANSNYKNIEEQLIKHTKRFHLIDSDYKYLNFTAYKLEGVEVNINNYEADITKQEQLLRDLEINIAKEKEVIRIKTEILCQNFDVERPLPKHLIIRRPYKEAIAGIQEQIKSLTLKQEELENYEQGLNRSHSSLSDFGNNQLDLTIDRDFEGIKIQELEERRKSILRDYGQEKRLTSGYHQKISYEFRKLLQFEQFHDEFFKQPLQNLLRHSENPEAFFETYRTVKGAFEHQLGKYEVDIANVERERAHVLEILKTYVLNVHQKLGKIDANSTINHRGKSLKMLKIQLSDWEANSYEFEKRLGEFIDNLVFRCLELLEQNQPIEEEICRQITTKQLYDTVVGTATIGIQLYKIEEQREIKISWEQVSKNSGGEGFLSAFVILTSLLSFMRHDDTNIFSTSEEGKVLLMDNPFAQTNAAHLLKPLMELAKKKNTQLICLSGLTGDSILSRFENIYSLSLVPSKLRKGTDFLKSDHLKSDIDQHTIIPSRLYVQDEEKIF